MLNQGLKRTRLILFCVIYGSIYVLAESLQYMCQVTVHDWVSGVDHIPLLHRLILVKLDSSSTPNDAISIRL